MKHFFFRRNEAVPCQEKQLNTERWRAARSRQRERERYLASLLDSVGGARVLRRVQVCQKEGVDQR